MKALSIVSVLHILFFIGAIAFFAWIGGIVGWNQAYEARAGVEAKPIGEDKRNAEAALDAVLAADKSGATRHAIASVKASGLSEQTSVLDDWKAHEEEMRDAITSAADDQSSTLDQAKLGVAERYQSLIGALRDLVSQRTEQHSALVKEVNGALALYAEARMGYAQNYANFLTLEFQHYLLQEEFEDRVNQLSRYRYLRPDLQARIGDNGNSVTGSVLTGGKARIKINKGYSDGVQPFQKFAVQRNGKVVAFANVTNVTNDSAEAEITDLPQLDWGVVPKAGDMVVTRRFSLTN